MKEGILARTIKTLTHTLTDTHTHTHTHTHLHVSAHTHTHCCYCCRRKASPFTTSTWRVRSWATGWRQTIHSWRWRAARELAFL